MIALTLAAALTCFSPRVVDGDTLAQCDGHNVRLAFMDAPETSRSPRCRHPSKSAAWACDPSAMAYAIPARDRLVELTQGRTVTCEERGAKSYGRTVAVCRVDGEDVGRVLVREGLARDYTRYSHGAYLADETRARRERRGMWGVRR